MSATPTKDVCHTQGAPRLRDPGLAWVGVARRPGPPPFWRETLSLLLWNFSKERCSSLRKALSFYCQACLTQTSLNKALNILCS